jgi:hypothetical protein
MLLAPTAGTSSRFGMVSPNSECSSLKLTEPLTGQVATVQVRGEMRFPGVNVIGRLQTA